MGFVHGYIGRVQYHVQYTIYPVVPDVLFNCMRLSTCARNAFVQLTGTSFLVWGILDLA